VPLITIPQHSPEDLNHWARWEEWDSVRADSDDLRRRIASAFTEIESFARGGPCYAAVSWGKDSVVLAHLVVTLATLSRTRIPLVHVPGPKTPRPGKTGNPHSPLVRDRFLAEHPEADYHEVESFAAAEQLLQTDRYVSGIRAQESSSRRARSLRGAVYGRSCAPLRHWGADDVWAYLWREDLPVHPVYACTYGGRISRDTIRVGSVGGESGTGFGRREWERAYGLTDG